MVCDHILVEGLFFDVILHILPSFLFQFPILLREIVVFEDGLIEEQEDLRVLDHLKHLLDFPQKEILSDWRKDIPIDTFDMPLSEEAFMKGDDFGLAVWVRLYLLHGLLELLELFFEDRLRLEMLHHFGCGELFHSF